MAAKFDSRSGDPTIAFGDLPPSPVVSPRDVRNFLLLQEAVEDAQWRPRCLPSPPRRGIRRQGRALSISRPPSPAHVRLLARLLPLPRLRRLCVWRLHGVHARGTPPYKASGWGYEGEDPHATSPHVRLNAYGRPVPPPCSARRAAGRDFDHGRLRCAARAREASLTTRARRARRAARARPESRARVAACPAQARAAPRSAHDEANWRRFG